MTLNPLVRRVTPVLAVVLLSGAASAETVYFHPEAGERRAYALDIAQEARGLGFTDLYRRNISVYLEVEPAADRSKRVLHVTPNHVFLDENDTWSTSASQVDWSEELWDLQRAGYEMRVEAPRSGDDESGIGAPPEPPDLVSAAPTLEERAGPLAERLHGGLADPFAAPAFPIPVEAEAGWHVTLDELYGYEDVTVEVTEVRDDRVYVAFSGGTGPGASQATGEPDWMSRGHRVAGRVVLDRDTGWVTRQVVTREGGISVKGNTAPGRITTVLTTLRDGAASYAPTDDSMDQPRPVGGSLRRDLGGASEGQLLQTEKARFEPLGEVMYLGIPADIERPMQAGRLTLDDVSLEDAAGEAIDLNVHVGPVYTYPDFGGGAAMVSSATLTPNAIRPVSYDEVARVTAQVSWYPPQTHFVEVRADESGRASLSESGLHVTLRPGNEPGTYLLRYSGAPDDWITWTAEGDQEATALTFAHERGPAWLSPSESQARMYASPAPEGQTVLLRTDASPVLRFRVDRPADQAAVTREVVFHPRRDD